MPCIDVCEYTSAQFLENEDALGRDFGGKGKNGNADDENEREKSGLEGDKHTHTHKHTQKKCSEPTPQSMAALHL